MAHCVVFLEGYTGTSIYDFIDTLKKSASINEIINTFYGTSLKKTTQRTIVIQIIYEQNLIRKAPKKSTNDFASTFFKKVLTKSLILS